MCRKDDIAGIIKRPVQFSVGSVQTGINCSSITAFDIDKICKINCFLAVQCARYFNIIGSQTDPVGIDDALNVDSLAGILRICEFAAVVFYREILLQIIRAVVINRSVPDFIEMSRTGYHGAELPGIDHACLADHNPFRAGKDKMPVNDAAFDSIHRTVDVNLISDKVDQMVDRLILVQLIKAHVGNVSLIQSEISKPVTPHCAVGLLDINRMYIAIGYHRTAVGSISRRNRGRVRRKRRHKKAGCSQSHQHLTGKVISFPRTG